MEEVLPQRGSQRAWWVALGVIVVLGLFGYGGYRYYLLAQELDLTTKNFEAKIKGLEENLTQAKNENVELLAKLEAEEEKNNSFEDQIDEIADTVGTLEKLSKTDRELLQKYSKIYFLNENYIPPKLTDIPPEHLFVKDQEAEIHTSVWPYLEDLIEAAAEDDITLQIISAYRSFWTQATLKAGYKVVYGAGSANQFSADQGYSEHQLGTTVDLTTPSVGGTFAKFEQSPAYQWLTENAYKYGFVLSYPKGNAYYQFEPWHWRFVGTDLARDLHRDNKNFYDLDQREIDKYLVKIFD